MRWPPLRSFILIGITILISALYVLREARNPIIIYGDAAGYYMYLPSVFIYHNPLSFYELPKDRVRESDVLWQMENIQLQGVRTEKGYVLNQYTYGVALMEAPFFFVAHGWALLSGSDANGFSPPYVLALRIGNLIYALLGLWLTYEILRRYFSGNISLLVTLSIFLGSNLFWFSLRQAGMSHNPLFFLYALLMWCSIRLYEQPRLGRFLAIGFIAGLITLMRPTDILCLIIPLFYGVQGAASLRERLQFFAAHRWAMLAAVIAFILPAIPQLVYWKAASGHWLVYSYGKQGFDWTHPHIFRGLWGGGNGWLAFSPLMALPLIGLLCWRYIRQWTVCIVLLLPLYIYVIYSWYCFNYINGLGSRPMIHLYPLLALPLAALLHWVGQKGFALKAVTALLMLFLISVNLSFSTLEARGLLNSEDSNWGFNLHMLFKSRLHYPDLIEKDIAIRQPQPGRLRFVRTLVQEDFNDSTGIRYAKDTLHGRGGSVVHMSDDEYSPRQLKVVWTKAAFGDAHWIRCSGRFLYPAPSALYENHVMVFSTTGSASIWRGVRIENKVGLADSTCPHEQRGDYTLDHSEPNLWGSVWFFVPLPTYDMQDGDVLELNIWNPAHRELYIDDLRMELWR